MENLIKFLRESRALSKSDVYKGIMSEYTYTNIENDIDNANFYSLIMILDRLSIPFSEFAYLYSNSKDIPNFFDDLNNELNNRIVVIDDLLRIILI